MVGWRREIVGWRTVKKENRNSVRRMELDEVVVL